MTDPHDKRPEFLIEIYKQMFNDINTHILVVWQSVGVVVGAFAVFALVEKHVIPLDLAVSLEVLLCCWLLAHLYDASYWYNRNLVIIANIERQFLERQDLKNVHYYFGAHRSKAAMLTHLRIQWMLGIGIGSLFLMYHFFTRVLPQFSAPANTFEPVRAIPYIITAFAIGLLIWLRRKRIRAYEEFLKNSPGIPINTGNVTYGVGHPEYQPVTAPAKGVVARPTQTHVEKDKKA